MLPMNVAIIGGGSSIKGNEEKLKAFLPSCFSIGINLSYKYFKTDMHTMVDPEMITGHKDFLESNPLSVVRRYGSLEKLKLNKTIQLPVNYKGYQPLETILDKGVYSYLLCGLFATTLALYMFMKAGHGGNIYLFGFDSKNIGKDDKGRPLTHFYQGKEEHGGIGGIKFYNTHDQHSLWEVYRNDLNRLDVNIINVSPESAIDNFKKISYDDLLRFPEIEKNINWARETLTPRRI